MAISDVDIANLALQKLGQQPIVSFDQPTPRAAAFNRCYGMYRDKMQRRRWNFNRAYTNLPALTAVPPFEYQYAYQLPDDYLRLELASQVQPNIGSPLNVISMPGVSLADYNGGRTQDYRIVGKQIWSNIPPPLSIIYGKRETDPNMFDAAFTTAFASYLAWELCELITNSNAKKATLAQEFKEAVWEALNAKAIELPPETIPDDTWMLARIGS
jgi:hypothetical protein